MTTVVRVRISDTTNKYVPLGEDDHGLYAEISRDADLRARLAPAFRNITMDEALTNSPTGAGGTTTTSDVTRGRPVPDNVRALYGT